MIAYLKTTNEKIKVGRETSMGYESWVNGKRTYIPAEDLRFPPTDKREFLTELKTLMEKYNAAIDWCCDSCSATSAIYDSRIEISLNDTTDISFFSDSVDVEDVNAKLISLA
jgi:hypothetical protein